MAQIAKILDSRFGHDILADTDILHRYVLLPSDTEVTETASCSPSLDPNSASDVNFMQSFLHDDSLHDRLDDEVISFLRAAAIEYKRQNPFEWWWANEKRTPTSLL